MKQSSRYRRRSSSPTAGPRLGTLTLVLALGLVASGVASAQPAATSFPTPVRTDQDTQATTIYQVVDFESFAAPLSQVASNAGAGSAEAFLQQVVASLVTGNLNAFTALADPAGDADLPELFARYAPILVPTPDPTVREVFHLGKLRYFVLEVSHPEAPIAPIPILETGGGFVHSFSLLLEPAVQNVSALARNRELDPTAYAPTNPGYTTEIVLPPLFGAAVGEHPVRLRFNGYPIPQNVSAEEKASRVPFAAARAFDFYVEYRAALAARDAEALPGFFGERSRQKLEKFLALAAARDPRGETTWRWLLNRQPPGSPAAKSQPTQNPIYIIVAGDLFLFFREPSTSSLAYEYVRYGSSGLEVVNFQRQNSLDTLLVWPPVATELQDEMP